MLKEILEKIGLNKGEIKVYMAIVESKKIGPAELSKKTRINRTTVYSIVKSLISKGMVFEDLGKEKKEFYPASPKELRSLLKQEEENYKKKEELIKKVMMELENVSVGKEYSPPKIRFVEENKIEDYMRSRNKEWNDSVMKYDTHWWGFQDHTFVDFYSRWIDSFWKQASKDLELKLLSNESSSERRMEGKYPRRVIKFWSKGNFTATTWVVGDYLVIVQTTANPHYLLEIHDATLAYNMRELFKTIWIIN
jgi:sugar-specific transcriptional regulator TrmB